MMRSAWPLPLILLAAGCGAQPGNDSAAPADAASEVVANDVVSDVVANDVVANAATVPATAPPAEAAATPAAEAPPPAADTAQGAAEVVRRYYDLLETGRYAEAYRLWEPEAAGMTAPAFAKGFARYAEYRAEIGAPGRVDAGAGQRYVEVPVSVHGTLRGGGPFAMAGMVTLHRAADIPGATAEQRSWRIRSADLTPPAATDEPPARVTARYRCIDGSRLTVDFDNRRDTATVARAGKRLATLAGQRPASGIWYRGGGYELRGKGADATFTAPDMPPMPCTESR